MSVASNPNDPMIQEIMEANIKQSERFRRLFKAGLDISSIAQLCGVRYQFVYAVIRAQAKKEGTVLTPIGRRGRPAAPKLILEGRPVTRQKTVIRHFKELIARLPELEPHEDSLLQIFSALRVCYSGQGKIMICGNGGSAADAAHIEAELLKSFMLPRPLDEKLVRRLQETLGDECALKLAGRLEQPLPALSLSAQSQSFFTAWSNDKYPETVFAQRVLAFSRPGDVLWCLSTSGNSENVINAQRVGKALGLRTIAFTAGDGGQLAKEAEVAFIAPTNSTPRAQEYHLAAYHTLCAMLEAEFFSASE